MSISISMIAFGILSAPLNKLAFNSSNEDKGVTASIFYTCMIGLGAIVTKLFGYIDYNIINFTIALILFALIQMLLFTITTNSGDNDFH